MGWGSWIRDPRSGSNKKLIRDPRSVPTGKAPDPDPQHWKNPRSGTPIPFLENWRSWLQISNFQYLLIILKVFFAFMTSTVRCHYSVFSKFSSYGNFKSLTLACGKRSGLDFRQTMRQRKVLLRIWSIFTESDLRKEPALDLFSSKHHLSNDEIKGKRIHKFTDL